MEDKINFQSKPIESESVVTKSKKTIVKQSQPPKTSEIKNAIQDKVDTQPTSKEGRRFKMKKIKDKLRLSRGKNIQKDLAEVYTDSNGEIPDLTKLERTQRPQWKSALYVLIFIFAVLLVVAIAGFLVFTGIIGGDGFTNEKVIFKIDPPITIMSGQEAIYTILITNKENINLYNAKLEMFYPDNFQYLEGVPEAESEKQNIWNFSVLRVGETQKIEIKGKVLAALNSSQTFKGILTFKPANLNATYKQDAIVDVLVSSSNIGLDISGPEKALVNQTVEYKLKYKNSSDENIVDLQLVIDYPDGFVFNKADPAADDGTNEIWTIDKMLAGAEGEVTVSGDYSAVEAGGNQEFKARVQIKQENDYYPQAEETLVTTIIKDQLTMQLIINGSAEDQPIGFGDLLVYSLNYKNTGEEDLENIEIIAHLDSKIIDWSTLRDESGGIVGTNTISWSGKDIAKLLKLGPNEEGEISWRVRVKDASVSNQDDIAKFSVESYIEAKLEQSGDTSGETTINTKTIVNSINSDLGISAGARYYNEDNIPLGLGPINPKVGETSTYNINIELTNNLHDVKDIRAVITLPQSISWSNKESHNTGDVVYNAGSNKVTWMISRLPKSTSGTNASFNVSITPSDNDLGRILILVSEIVLTAKDADTGADISKNIKAITTAFDDPILGQVRGIVE